MLHLNSRTKPHLKSKSAQGSIEDSPIITLCILFDFVLDIFFLDIGHIWPRRLNELDAHFCFDTCGIPSTF